MKDKKETYCIIPARKNSKRIPNKNKKLFCGKPLISWTIEEALKVKEIDHIIVTSDDNDILDIGKKYGVGTHKREARLCEDNTPAWVVANSLMSYLRAPKDAVIIYLQPTSPLRTAKEIKACYYFYKIMDCDSVISCYRNNTAYYSFKLAQGFLEPLFYGNYLNNRTQELPEAFVPNGAVAIISNEYLNSYGSFYTPRTKGFVMEKESSADIDDYSDWLFAEFLMRVRLSKC